MIGKSCFRQVSAWALALVFATLVVATAVSAEAWRFGVMADTQWKANLDGQNPNTVAVGIVNQLNREFVNRNVKFVIQVGDLTDNGADASMDTRAAAAQPLYDAGIGFYPLCGNHEGSLAGALRFQTDYPQTQNSGRYVYGATNFSSPFATLKGLSYSFDYNNARFILLDQFTRTDNTNYLGDLNNNIVDQVGWVKTQLSTRRADSHAFVFGHKELIGQNHVDTLFGANPSGNPVAQNAFIGALAANGVRYCIGGHDHMHHRSIVASPDFTSKVQEIICSSNSYKFYTPANPSNDATYDVPANGIAGPREATVAEELYTVGYYIYTVDGPRVTIDYYSSDNGFCSTDVDLTATPNLSFTKRETFGYSLNGKEFVVAQGESYNKVVDSFKGTTAQIIDGVNGSSKIDGAGRPFVKTVDTGWTPQKSCNPRQCDDTDSNILTLWGMADLGNAQTDTFVLSMSYDLLKSRRTHLTNGGFGIATKGPDGKWINAVSLNTGGKKTFVKGPWNPTYQLGTYGVDTNTRTAWAVINYNGDFAVSDDIK